MAKNNLNKLILCATSQQVLVGLWHGTKLQGSQQFSNDEAGQAAFAEFINQYPKTSVYLIADAVEEDYRLENLPHASGAARQELVERKLNQYYRGLEYRTAHFINRDTDKRRDDRFLFAALNNADFLQTWVKLLVAAEALVVGIYLLPMLSQVLVRQLKLMAPHILLCERLSSGLRQTYLHNGRLRMSRLISNVPQAANQLSYFYLVETEKTRLYLISQRFISRDTPLNLVFASVNGDTQHISSSISQEQGMACTDVNLGSIVKNLGLPFAQVQQMPELLHMQLLASGHRVDNLAPAHLTKQYQVGKIQQSIKIGTLALTILGLVTAGVILKQALDYRSAFIQAQQDTAIQQHHYDEVAKNFPQTTISASDLQTAVEIDKIINTYPKSPRRVMQVVSGALEKSPEIQLNRLRWLLTNDVNIADDDKSLVQTVQTPAANQQSAPLAVATDPAQLNELGFLTAEIAGFTGDYRGALDSMNRFVNLLKTDVKVAAVEILQAPVNVSSYVDLQGSTTDEQSNQRQPAIFKLKVILKPVVKPVEETMPVSGLTNDAIRLPS
jgi:hypothetical protein